MPAALARAGLLVLLLATPLEAQREPPVQLSVHPGTGEVTVQLGDLLSTGGLSGALESGLPVRVRVVTELWRDRLFDSEEGRFEWRASVIHDPLERTYRLQATAPLANERIVATLDEAAAALQIPFVPPLRPSRPGRYYYIARVEVETLSLSDLEELGRWLRGDLAPAVAGEERVEGALGRGLGRLLVRVLGLPARRIRERTPTFEVR